MSWVGKLWQHNYIHRLSLKLDISKDKWSKNLPVSGENKAQMRHVKTPLEKKTNHPPYTSSGE
jgi:hypothetical protein